MDDTEKSAQHQRNRWKTKNIKHNEKSTWKLQKNQRTPKKTNDENTDKQRTTHGNNWEPKDTPKKKTKEKQMRTMEKTNHEKPKKELAF